MKLKLVLIAPHFPPLNTSAAIQLRDLSKAIIDDGFDLTVLVPDQEILTGCEIEITNGVKVIRLKVPKFNNVSNVRRFLAELIMPYFMLWNLSGSLNKSSLDGLIWYSPSIFFAPLVRKIKKKSKCRSYLILRDIFPDWALHLGLIRKGIAYKFLKWIEINQYKLADFIGVQTFSNLKYFDQIEGLKAKVHVLHNWLEPVDLVSEKCNIFIESTKLRGRKIFVYTGNMGVAQDLDIFLSLAKSMEINQEIGFLFIGRGSEALRIKNLAAASENILFFDEINNNQIPALLSQCHFGMLSLDKRHKIDNIPGKFLSYISCGLPVLACVNKGNDLVYLINNYKLGEVDSTYSVDALNSAAERLLKRSKVKDLSVNCVALSRKLYDPKTAVSVIKNSLFG